MERGGREGEGDEKIIKMHYIHVPPPHDECDYYVFKQISMKIKIFKKWKEASE